MQCPCIDISLSLYIMKNVYGRLMHNDRDTSIQGHCVSGTIHFGDLENSYRGTSFRAVHHPHHLLQKGYLDGGEAGRHETMCPRTNVLGPLVH